MWPGGCLHGFALWANHIHSWIKNRITHVVVTFQLNYCNVVYILVGMSEVWRSSGSYNYFKMHCYEWLWNIWYICVKLLQSLLAFCMLLVIQGAGYHWITLPTLKKSYLMQPNSHDFSVMEPALWNDMPPIYVWP